MIRVLALSRRQENHYAPLRDSFDITLTEDWSVEMLHRHSPDILLTLSDDWYESYAVIQEARQVGIPSLLLMDGIIEWRHIWLDPAYGHGGGVAYYQPIQTDKVACLGWQSARTLAAWGNLCKCEIIGAPRFDHYLTEPISAPADHTGTKRLLVMTANTPGFTPEQIKQVEQSLCDVRDYLRDQHDWEPIWRVRKGLDAKLGLRDNYPNLRGQPLRTVLATADAVLTTPSTVLLESMLAHRPTALLDYSNSPPYVGTAWNITAPIHIPLILAQLRQPHAARLVYQDELLHNHLECHSLATPRLVELIHKMAEIGRTARAQGMLPVFPPRIVRLMLGGQAIPSEHFDWTRLYPHHPIYTQSDLRTLQMELTHARTEIAELRRQLRKARRQTVFYTLARRILKRS